MHDNILTTFIVLNIGVKLLILLAVLGQEILNHLVIKELFLSNAQYLESLLLGNKAAFDS